MERASEEKRMDAAAAELRKKVKEEKQRLLELQRLNSSLEREVYVCFYRVRYCGHYRACLLRRLLWKQD